MVTFQSYVGLREGNHVLSMVTMYELERTSIIWSSQKRSNHLLDAVSFNAVYLFIVAWTFVEHHHWSQEQKQQARPLSIAMLYHRVNMKSAQTIRCGVNDLGAFKENSEVSFVVALKVDGSCCWFIFLMWVCRNAIGTTHQIDGWNPTHKNGDFYGGWFIIAIFLLQLEDPSTG